MLSKKVKIDSHLLFSLLVVTCSLLIGCDLFNTKLQDDYFAKIDEEIRWSNAAKLNVRIEYPSAWGVSTPSAGRITPSPMDIRQGYAFELEFTPDPAYSFLGWRAYATSDISLFGNWVNDPGRLTGVPQLSDVDIPAIEARGGKVSLTINTTTPVTLVPWCGNDPYVVRSEPRNEGRSNNASVGVHPSSMVIFYFNSQLLLGRDMDFEPGIVGIKARPIGDIALDRDFSTDWSGRFEKPMYESKDGQHMVTIVPKTSGGPIAGYQVEVTIGPGIRNINGVPMAKEEVLYYKVFESGVLEAYIASWSATYNDSAGTISVNYTIGGTQASSTIPTVYYQMNQGANQRIDLGKSGNNYTGTITGVTRLEANDIWKGGAFGYVREYRIFIELGLGGTTVNDNFKIWNFPGMSVSNTKAIEIFSAADLAAIPTTGLSRQYVLGNDIIVSSHNPIGSDTAAFTGKFYGGGHTITINSFGNATKYTGLFGNVNNALIRDLSVAYNNTTITSNNVITSLGGVAGWATGTTEIRNIITSGNLTAQGLTNTASSTKYVGGITGTMPVTTGTIANIRAGLNLSATTSGTGDVCFGGITGDTNEGANSSRVAISSVTVTGTLTHNQSGTGAMYTGGVAGWFRVGVTVSDIEFSGKLSVNNTSTTATTHAGGFLGNLSAAITINRPLITGDITCKAAAMIYCGGGIGRAINAGTLTDFYSLVPSISATSTGNINAGGLIGVLENGTSLTRCYAKTDVYVSGNATVSAGGLVGNSHITSGTTAVTQCYATGTVVTEATNTSNLCAGGLIGYFGGNAGTTITVTNSYALGNASADSKSVTDGATYAGGLVGHFTTAATTASGISNCFAAGIVLSRAQNYGYLNTGGWVYSGGLVGRIAVGGSSGFLSNNVVRNSIVGRTGGGDGRRAVARVFANNAGITQGNLKNYALSTITIEASNFYEGSVFDSWNGQGNEPSYYWTTSPPNANSSGNSGERVDNSYLYNSTFWTGLVYFNATYWNLLSTGARGYPSLVGVGGQ